MSSLGGQFRKMSQNREFIFELMDMVEALRDDATGQDAMLKKLKAFENLQTLTKGKTKNTSEDYGFDNSWTDYGVGHDGGKSITVEPLDNFDMFGIANFCVMSFLLCWLYATSIYSRIVKSSRFRKSLFIFQLKGKLERQSVSSGDAKKPVRSM